MQSLLVSICAGRFRPAFQNRLDLYALDPELEDLDLGLLNEFDKTLAKAALKFLAGPGFPSTCVRNFLALDFQVLRTPFYLRKALLKSSKPFPHNVAVFFPGGFPNPDNVRLLGDYRRLLGSLLFADLLVFPAFDHARNFALICQKYLGIATRTQEGGRLYLEFDGRILLINVFHPYLAHPSEPPPFLEEPSGGGSDYDLLSSSGPQLAARGKTLEQLCEDSPETVLIVGLDRIDSSSLVELKFQAFRGFAQGVLDRSFVLVELLYSVFEDGLAKNPEYIDRLTQIAKAANQSLGRHRIEVFYCNKVPRQSLRRLYARAGIFLKLSLIRDESYLHHLEYLSLNPRAVVVVSANMFQTRAFKSILTVNALNLQAVQAALRKAESLLGERSQESLVMLDREYLRANNVARWLEHNLACLQGFSFYHDKQFRLSLERSEDEVPRLVPQSASFEEFEVKQIASAFPKSRNRVLVLDFEGVFLDLERINAALGTRNVLEIESKLQKCKPSLALISDETLSKFRNIVQNPRNSVYVISTLAHEKLAFFFPDMKPLTLFSENGYLCQRLGRDEAPFVNFYEKADTSWKSIVQNVILDYVGKTEGSYLVEKKYSLLWVFDKVDREFAEIQAKELMEHLTEVLEFIEVIEIVKYETLIEVRLRNCHKGMGCAMAVYEAYLGKGPIDFFLCVGGTRDFSSDLFLASRTLRRSKDQLFAEVSFFAGP